MKKSYGTIEDDAGGSVSVLEHRGKEKVMSDDTICLSEPLTEYQIEVMAHQLKDHDQTFCFSLENARQFCKTEKLTDKTHTIVEDLKRARFFIEPHEASGMIRGFEVVHRIAA